MQIENYSSKGGGNHGSVKPKKGDCLMLSNWALPFTGRGTCSGKSIYSRGIGVLYGNHGNIVRQKESGNIKKTLCRMVISLGCLLLLSNAVGAQSVERISGDNWFGSTNKEEFTKIVGYIVAKDNQAFKAAMTGGILRGTVTMFTNGEEVYIVDTAIFSGLVKVRRKGDTSEYWTNIEAVK